MASQEMNGCLVMKLLKEEMRQRIVEAARDEFFQSGYARASMRAIAQQAGLTVGNIYLYFPGKEQLFDAIVGETVRQIQEITRLPSANNDTIRKMADALRATFVQNRVEFMILVTRSSGSKYENYKQMLITLAQRRMREEFVARGYEALYDPLAVAIMEGLMEIFRTYDGDEKRLEQSLVCFLNYMLGGLLSPGSN